MVVFSRSPTGDALEASRPYRHGKAILQNTYFMGLAILYDLLGL
jgi:hypothetical protein